MVWDWILYHNKISALCSNGDKINLGECRNISSTSFDIKARWHLTLSC